MIPETRLITPPTLEPITLVEAKGHLRVDQASEDATIARMISAARTRLEEYLAVKFITQTWDIYFNRFPVVSKRSHYDDDWVGVREGAIGDYLEPAREVDFPFGPIQDLLAFETYADDGVPVIADVDDFVIDRISYQGKVALKRGGLWPSTELRRLNGIRFRVIAGFGAPRDVPDDIKHSILDFVSFLYENRGDSEKKNVPPHVSEMVNHYRRYRL